MTAIRGVRKLVDRFDRAQALTTTAGFNGWTLKKTAAGGSPTSTTTKAGMVLTLAATSEAECLTMAQNDILIYPLANLDYVWWTVSIAGVDSVTTMVAGVADAENDTAHSVANAYAWFSVQGATSTSVVVAETYDGTNTNNTVATGVTLSSTLRKMVIDFTRGLSDVRFIFNGADVALATTFDMSKAAAGQGVQPYIQLAKASGTGVPALTIREFGVQYSFADGS